MAVTTTKTNKPINPRGNDQSPKGYNRASLFSGKALDFDGVNDYVDLDGFTMAGNVATIVFSTTFENNNYFFDINTQRFVITNTSSDGFRVYNSNAWASYGDTLRDEIGFYAVVSDGTTQRVYYNGHQLGSDQTVTALNWSSATQVKIGSHNGGGTNYFNGQLSGFKIFNTALTAAQVADLYNNPEKIVPTGVADSALKLWLPMQEGAGTTAYDGSGNGNHGTISGATYVNGVGSPVAQSAVIDWNKGTNELLQSNNFDNASWGNVNLTIESGQTGFDGTNNAFRFKTSNTNGAFYVEQNSALTSQNVFSVYAKADGYDYLFLFNSNTGKGKFYNLANGTLGSDYGSAPDDSSIIAIGDGWYKCTLTNTPAAASSFRMFVSNQDGVFIYQGDGTSGILVQHSQVQVGTDIGPYVETLATRQTSPVLLPQGLTSGRDITGVNLFENVRKQGALNLDGNSWAEVHDNASLDFSSGMTLEAWFQIEANSFGRHVLGKWNFPSNKREYLIYWNGTTNKIECYFGNAGAAQSANVSVTPTGQWVHFVGTTDGSTITPYLNGVAGTTAAQTTALGDSDIDLKIGTDDTNTGAQYRMNTPVAQPRIYNRALTAEEVERNFTAGKYTYNND